jgi:hypothetical protein
MPEDFDGQLREGAARFAAAMTPGPAHLIRARGDQRRRRRAAGSAVLALAVILGGGGVAYATIGQPGPPVPPLSPPAPSETQGRSASGTPAPDAPVPQGAALAGAPGIVAVTASGAVVLLDPATGTVTRALVVSGAVGDEVSVSPDGSTVYYAVRRGCTDQVESVPVSGGSPTAITAGVLPAISPDGTKLAVFREPYGSDGEPVYGCVGTSGPQTAQFMLVVRDLSSGAETVYRSPPGIEADLPVPVSHLSWAPDGGRLAVSAGGVQGNMGWGLVMIHPATDRHYLPAGYSAASGQGVPVAGARGDAGGYYREGVFLPDGHLFVSRVCCAGVPVRNTSSLMWEIDTGGRLVRKVAAGFTDRHTSLNADATGHWLLYLSGSDLFVSANGNASVKLTSGLLAAAWR